ncbi:hypothetical protein BJ875DRAFT_389470 [Amylocarpus encephaloides]|uniref:Uncharacterized protein n=1 Tax=Amylocarpus encephaloides TaxID=45428 RepID=A0A9P7Y794_9HELO|nr:hypothetical protein BJ875DRAFT_389470 [Amylocarpus encephaloides]
MEDNNGGLFGINIDSSDEVTNEKEKVRRDFQSEGQFQRQRELWRPKIETGKLYKHLHLPINNPSKPESQEILHAIEEWYFFKQYEEGMRVAEETLKGELAEDFRKIVADYKTRCQRKLEGS